jgi:hypothetical protein
MIDKKPNVKVLNTKKSQNYHKFYEIDINSLGEPEVTGSHYIYQCPWCSAERKDKKLYYNYKTGIGLCFRCETVIVSKHVDVKKVDLTKFSWLNFLSSNTYLDISWTDTALISNEVKIYLSKRKYFYDVDIIGKFNLRSFTGVNGETVLLLPNNFPNTVSVDSFQTSVISGKNYGPKYLTYSDNKVIYFLDKIENPKTIVFVEGIFDAISVTNEFKDKLTACCLLGKSISRSQQRQFYLYMKSHDLKEVIVALDGDVNKERCIKTCRQLLSVNSSIKVYFTTLPNELDPEEAVCEGIFGNCLEQAKRVVI